MSQKITKILSLVLCFLLCFQQSGFTQVAAQLDISSHLAGLRNSFTPDVFRPLHLRYLSYNPQENNFQLFLDKGSLKDPNPQELKDTTKTLLNYFFIGLALPNDTFWVNLRPDSPDNIINDSLAQTDVGRIMLETDLQLKKDTARFTSPETPEGGEYWDKLYKKAGEIFGSQNITIPTLTRPWIVPDEIIIRETQDSAYIYKAMLKVMLEQDYLKGSTVYNFEDGRLKELNEYSSQLIREIIIPKLTKEVNSSKRYAQLRQVYYSLIMAQWFKARYNGKDGLYSHLINRRDLTNLTSKENWSKTTYFKEYQKSFKDGEYDIQKPIYTPYGQTIRSYFSGGISGIAPTIANFGETRIDTKTGTVSSSIVSRDPANLNPKVVIGVKVDAVGDVKIKGASSNFAQQSESVSSPVEASSPMIQDEDLWEEATKSFDRVARGIPVRSTASVSGVRQRLPYMKVAIVNTVFYMYRNPGIHPDAKWRYDIKIKTSVNGYEHDFGIGFLVFTDKNYEPLVFAVDAGLLGDSIFIAPQATGVYVLGDIQRDRAILDMLLDKIKEQIPHPQYEPLLNASNFQDENQSYQLFTSYLKKEDRDKLANFYSSNVYFRHLFNYLFRRGDSFKVGFGKLLFLIDKTGYQKAGGAQDFYYHPHGVDLNVKLEGRYAFNESGDQLINDQVLIHELIHAIYALWMESYEENEAKKAVLQYLKGREKLLEVGQLSAGVGDIGDESYASLLLNEALAYLFESVYFWLSNPDATQPSYQTRLSRDDITYEDIEFLHKLGLLPDESLTSAKNIFSTASSPAGTNRGEEIIKAFEKSFNEAAGMGRSIIFSLALQDLGLEVEDLYGHYDPEYDVIVVRDEIISIIGNVAKMERGAAFNFKGIVVIPESILRKAKRGDKESLMAIRHEKRHNEYRALHSGADKFSVEQASVDELYAYFSSFVDIYGVEALDQEQQLEIGRGLYSMAVAAIIYHDYINGVYSDSTTKEEKDYLRIMIYVASIVIHDLINTYGSDFTLAYLKKVNNLGAIASQKMSYEALIGYIEHFERHFNLHISHMPEEEYHRLRELMQFNESVNLPPKATSSPMRQEQTPGGIDFRSLPIVTQAVTKLSANISSLAIHNLISINLDEEWRQIERMTSSRITPSSERIKEYIQTSCAQENIIQDRDKILLCISDILRLEEERCESTNPILRDILVVLESINSAQEFKEIFLGKAI